MAKRKSLRRGKTLMEVFAEVPVDVAVPDEAEALVRELDRSVDQCPLCQRWNSRTRGHTPGCRLGLYLGRIEQVG